MSLLFRAASAERRGVEEKAGTSPIESHFGARLIYFFLLLVRMQMVASHRSELFPTPGLCPRFLWHGPFEICSFPSRRFLPLSLSFSLFFIFLPRISIPLICLALIVREA